MAGVPQRTFVVKKVADIDTQPERTEIAAGLHGVEKSLKLTAPPITGTNQGGEHIPRAPRSLWESTQIFKGSRIARDWLGDTFVEHYAATREWEVRQSEQAVTDWELARYFEAI